MNIFQRNLSCLGWYSSSPAYGADTLHTKATRQADYNIPRCIKQFFCSLQYNETHSSSPTPITLTPVCSPPPRRKYATLTRCSSWDVITDTGSDCSNPQGQGRLHQTLAVCGHVRHSVSQPNGFYGWKDVPELSVNVHKKSVSYYRALHFGTFCLCKYSHMHVRKLGYYDCYHI